MQTSLYLESGNQTIISKGGNFELGFFKAGNSSNYYIGIWYKKVSFNPPTVVWVANRETPISDRFSSKFKLKDGNLVLLNESNTPIWSTNMISTATPASVVLHDDGNLVLLYGSSSSTPIWQSFDHPTHTFLPGSKLGYNKRTKTSHVITSWKNKEDPAAGLFSLEIVQNTKRYALKWNRSVEYWSSGPWNGRFFSSLPDMEVPYIYNFSYIDNANESYFIYWSTNPSIISGMVLDVSGQMQQLTWKESSEQWYLFWSQPKQICDVYAKCGAFSVCNQQTSPFCNCLTGFEPTSQSDWNLSEFSGGCVRKTKLNCRVKEEKSEFIVSYVPVKYFPTSHENETSLLDESACRRSCLDDCSCDEYSLMFEKCRLWNNENLNNISLVFVSDDSTVRTFKLNIKVASKDVQHPIKNIHKNDKVSPGTVVESIAGVAFVLGLIILIICRKKCIRVEKTRMEGSLVAFVYRDLQIATKNFSDKLGGGGFGSVFKGVLRDSSIVAVKKLESASQGEKQFRSEVSTIGTIQHVNLVRLRGFCAQGSSKLLVYDYMPNGSLDSHLFSEKEDNLLNWKTRYEIALGIARGLVYLHEKCRDCIIHCDIKPENILLDADFCPKLADFGLAKLVGREFSRVLTTFRGTKGYLAPEWLSGVPVTAKADVFSYGMMLFELVYGKRNAEQSDDSTSKFFPSLVANVLMVGGDILSLLDSRLNREASVEEVTKICKVACWCIQDEEDSRPSMSLVEQILEGVSDVNMPPVPRTVKLFLDNMEPIVFFTESSSNESPQVLGNSSAVILSKSASSST
ncbi:putative protein kinase RLK-Pelle-SD-2b family [Helianthus annuus]|nr:putative protein kinase RLK-Pelle-SD-2b family [Helianthus annuus]KAJ0631624.1 putative protein kinase RLK-Pelle-SD-2b family [Helianthus annuus]KAJ0825363.1 putative protein kinase RLK-Pelle-SD-2b family [Helianthus annuus]